MFLISIMHDNKHQFTHSKLHINFFLSSFSFYRLSCYLLFSLLSGIASWFTDLVTKYMTHTWRFFYKMQPNFMIHGRIFLWIWVTHMTQIVSQGETIITNVFNFAKLRKSLNSKWAFFHKGSFSMDKIIIFWNCQQTINFTAVAKFTSKLNKFVYRKTRL